MLALFMSMTWESSALLCVLCPHKGQSVAAVGGGKLKMTLGETEQNVSCMWALGEGNSSVATPLPCGPLLINTHTHTHTHTHTNTQWHAHTHTHSDRHTHNLCSKH